MSTEEKLDLVLTKVQTLELNTAKVFSVETLAAYLKVSISTVQQITRPQNNLIKHTKVGKAKVFTLQAVNDYLEKYSSETA